MAIGTTVTKAELVSQMLVECMVYDIGEEPQCIAPVIFL